LGRSQQYSSTLRTRSLAPLPHITYTSRLREHPLHLQKEEQEQRVGDRTEDRGSRFLQEVVVSAKGEEAVDALDEGALEDGPLPA
jgi:hypothetical protein